MEAVIVTLKVSTVFIQHLPEQTSTFSTSSKLLSLLFNFESDSALVYTGAAEQAESGGGLKFSEARKNGGLGLALEFKLRPFKHQRNGYL